MNLHPAPTPGPRSGRRRTASALAAVAAAGALTVGSLSPAHASPSAEPPGAAWPDGSYSVTVRGSAAGTGGGGELASGTVSAMLTGRFGIEIAAGTTAGSSDAYLLYLFQGSGVTTSGIPGSGTLQLDMSGYAQAEDGRVAIHRESAVGTWTIEGYTLPPQTTVLGDRFLLVADYADCGIVEGTMLGTFEGLAQAAPIGASGELQVVSDFLAVSDLFTGDPEAWVVETSRITDEIVELDRAYGNLEVGGDEALAQLRRLLDRAEDSLAAFEDHGCTAPGDFGLGVGAAAYFLLYALLEASSSPLELGQIAALAAQAGVLDPDLSAEVLDRVNEYHDVLREEFAGGDVEYAAELYHLAGAAAAAGDSALADALLAEYLEIAGGDV